MVAYITDDGNPMDQADFSQYARWLIEQYHNEGKDWQLILTIDFWGDQLLDPRILTEI